MHINGQLYNSEAVQRVYSYPPPYYSNTSHAWVYATPWLWVDGNKHDNGYTHWTSWIVNEMNQEAQATIRMWGFYNRTTLTGTINARYINETDAPMNGNVLFIITEDSIFYTTPRGDPLHNHVARDYIPNYIGSSVSIASRDSVTVSYPFTISSSWNDKKCEIVTFIQNPVMTNDSNKPIWQGAKVRVYQLPYNGVEEQNEKIYPLTKIIVAPNPCVNETRFAFSLPKGTGYKINIFDVSGREVKTLNGIATGKNDRVNLRLNDINSGIYFYRFSSNIVNTAGKIIIK